MKVRFLLPIVTCAFLFSPPFSALHAQHCDVPDYQVEAYNRLLDLPQDSKDALDELHFPWGLPQNPASSTNEVLLHQEECIINYDEDLRIPVWVGYRLTNDDVVSRSRLNCFRPDPRLDDDVSATLQDYLEPLYDRGHLVPRADMNRSESAMINTFILSNIAPMHDHFNQGVWERLERLVRIWATERREIFIITGSVFDDDGDNRRDLDSDADLMRPTERVAVPTHFYKIIMHRRPTGYIDSIAILLPHDEAIAKNQSDATKDRWIAEHVTTIENLEELTGINFSSELADNQENAVERSRSSHLWSTPYDTERTDDEDNERNRRFTRTSERSRRLLVELEGNDPNIVELMTREQGNRQRGEARRIKLKEGTGESEASVMLKILEKLEEISSKLDKMGPTKN